MNDLNPGIRKLVAILRAGGFETTDSGDGETHLFECDRPYGYVTILVPDKAQLVSEADRLMDYLASLGLEAVPQAPEGVEGLGPHQCHIEASYSPTDGFAVLDVQGVHDRMLRDIPSATFKFPKCEVCEELPCQCCEVCGGPCQGH